MDATVVVAARDAQETLGRTLAALERQDFGGSFEVIVVLDRSSDASRAIAEASSLAPEVIDLPAEAGAGAGAARNFGVRSGTGTVLAFTDADCEPDPGWLAAGADALALSDLVQGPVEPDPSARRTPFDRTLALGGPNPFYETANLFVRRAVFESLGGFEDWVKVSGATRHGGRPMGEDTWFGWRARRAGARTGFAPSALVHHAVFPRSASAFVAESLRYGNIPALVRRIPELRDEALFMRLFLSRRAAAFDLAAAGLVLALLRRSSLPFVLALPYVILLRRDGLPWPRRTAVRVAAICALADCVSLGARAAGSVRAQTPVL